jgi:hypothetical protein
MFFNKDESINFYLLRIFLDIPQYSDLFEEFTQSKSSMKPFVLYDEHRKHEIISFEVHVRLKKYCAKPKSPVSWYSKNFGLQTMDGFRAGRKSIRFFNGYARQKQKK